MAATSRSMCAPSAIREREFEKKPYLGAGWSGRLTCFGPGSETSHTAVQVKSSVQNLGTTRSLFGSSFSPCKPIAKV
eukprot:scaffold4405_cov31-Tisochrysis_lutea.AAC.4